MYAATNIRAIPPVHIRNCLKGGIFASTSTALVLSRSISLSLTSIAFLSISTVVSKRSVATPDVSCFREYDVFILSPSFCCNCLIRTLPTESHSSQALSQALSGGMVIMLSLTISLTEILSFVVITCGLYVLQLTTHRAIIIKLTIFDFVNSPVKAANIFA